MTAEFQDFEPCLLSRFIFSHSEAVELDRHAAHRHNKLATCDNRRHLASKKLARTIGKILVGILNTLALRQVSSFKFNFDDPNNKLDTRSWSSKSHELDTAAPVCI